MAAVGRLYFARKIYLDIKFITKILEQEQNIKNEQKVGMLLKKRRDTGGVGISNIYTSLQQNPLATPIDSTHSH